MLKPNTIWWPNFMCIITNKCVYNVMATNIFSIYFQVRAIGMAMQNKGNSNNRL